MTLYEIEKNIISILDNSFSVNEETGELLFTEDDLEKLQLDRQEKIENIALYIKALNAESEAIKAEERKLTERRKVKENKAERLKGYLADSLLSFGETKFESSKVALSFRKSDRVIIDDLDKIPEEFTISRIEISADKAKIKKVLKDGQAIAGAKLEECNNLQIK